MLRVKLSEITRRAVSSLMPQIGKQLEAAKASQTNRVLKHQKWLSASVSALDASAGVAEAEFAALAEGADAAAKRKQAELEAVGATDDADATADPGDAESAGNQTESP